MALTIASQTSAAELPRQIKYTTSSHCIYQIQESSFPPFADHQNGSGQQEPPQVIQSKQVTKIRYPRPGTVWVLSTLPVKAPPSLGIPFQYLITLMAKKYLLVFRLPAVPPAGTNGRGVPLSISTHQVLQTHRGGPKSLPFSRLKRLSSLSLYPHKRCSRS